ncbi:uncharacterized protein LOC107042034 [Diachasma alloeum]|uniref:uncharacterized protein LOC107042034 n=1 Tax=Diachasma alloeum TaxID=454923 RepID=UPI0007382FEA|nr:uncharacterized protein LOC107042034 [Diachasma alloeum]
MVVSLEGYKLFRRDRNRRGGGVPLFINNCFRVKVLASSSHVWTKRPGLPEYLFCEIACHGVFPIFVAVVYRPPHAPFVECSDFIPSLQMHLQEYSSKVTLGDFNADQLSSANADAVFVRSICSDNSLRRLEHGATHHTSTSDTWLDLCQIDCEDTLLSCWKTDAPFVDGHDLIAAVTRVFLPRPPLSSDICYRDFSSLDDWKLNSWLVFCDWSGFEGSSSLDSMVLSLCSNLCSAIDESVPLKTVRKSSKRKPWFTRHVNSLVAERDHLYRVYKRVHSRRALEDYRLARDRAHREVEGARQLYFQRRMEPLSEPAQVWKELMHFGVVHVENLSADLDPEALNDHFADLSFDSNEPLVADFLNSMEASGSAAVGGFSFRPVTADEVPKAIWHFSTEAKGADGIPRSVVTAAVPSLLPFLLKLFNKSFAVSSFPPEWKKSLIVALGKVLERLASLQILGFLTECSILDPLQTGFRPYNGTQTALLKLTDDIRRGIDKRQLTMLLLFDFSKAFDSVCHVMILQKLLSIGNSFVPFETSVRSLGVVLDCKLTWRDHVAGVTRRVHSVMYHLRFFRASTTLALRKHLIETLVFPLVDYCCLVYGGLSEELSQDPAPHQRGS